MMKQKSKKNQSAEYLKSNDINKKRVYLEELKMKLAKRKLENAIIKKFLKLSPIVVTAGAMLISFNKDYSLDTSLAVEEIISSDLPEMNGEFLPGGWETKMDDEKIIYFSQWQKIEPDNIHYYRLFVEKDNNEQPINSWYASDIQNEVYVTFAFQREDMNSLTLRDPVLISDISEEIERINLYFENVKFLEASMYLILGTLNGFYWLAFSNKLTLNLERGIIETKQKIRKLEQELEEIKQF